VCHQGAVEGGAQVGRAVDQRAVEIENDEAVSNGDALYRLEFTDLMIFSVIIFDLAYFSPCGKVSRAI